MRPPILGSGRIKLSNYERFNSMARCSMVSAVVTTLLLNWKPRWVMIMVANCRAMSTLDNSRLLPLMLPKFSVLAVPS